MATIKDVAKASGVSVATVSRAINNSGYVHEDTLKKINEAVAKLDYKPNETARALYNKQSKIIGLLIPDITNPFFTLVARGVEDTALENGYHIFIGNSDQKNDKEIKYIDTFQQNNCVGFISSALQLEDSKKYVEASGMKHVMLDRLNEAPFSVEADHYKGGRLQAECLVNQGCQNILVISGNPIYSSFKKRLDGTVDYLKQNDVSFSVLRKSLESINEMLLDEINYHKYDGIICYNDLIAIHVMGVLQNNGIKVPNDIQVVGFDDIQISKYTFPSLTTVRQPAYFLGKIACEQLLKILKNEPVEAQIKVDVSLIERNSTK
ncbi:LacI family DNA-binding transcriptional regulator [Macrococcus sp. DPC7161]|uniref:LacI family DNA-binding transcriptional regulator n=1 Tax=Macrococcus sp. DPC7161 TaxID=2507060 RepID=UPI00100B111E|nr:LacI family DNA-binding transcriptional regulator [Macrococcus sp. DPC7161]RXK17893.1 LacI family transcriptional regulator [Macrococcus sp. DPC7161]